jgi:hypothetical protein
MLLLDVLQLVLLSAWRETIVSGNVLVKCFPRPYPSLCWQTLPNRRRVASGQRSCKRCCDFTLALINLASKCSVVTPVDQAPMGRLEVFFCFLLCRSSLFLAKWLRTHVISLGMPSRGANWLWCGAPPNLFSSIICTTSAQFWRSSTNNWGGLEVHLTVTPLQSYLSSYSFLVGLQEECYYCILERESKSDAGWTQNECKNIFLYHSEVWNLDFAFSKDQNACHAHC